jgi:hypothetical protein
MHIVAKQQSPFILLIYLPPARNRLELFDIFIPHAQRIYEFSIEKEARRRLDNVMQAP